MEPVGFSRRAASVLARPLYFLCTLGLNWLLATISNVVLDDYEMCVCIA